MKVIKWRTAVAVASIVGSLVGLAGASSAGALDPCAARVTTKAFSQWGDNNDYFLVTGGSFENGATGWTTVGNTGLVNDQAPWKVNGSGHYRSLHLSEWSSATTTQMCVASNEEWLRFFFTDPGRPGAALSVKVVVTNSLGARAENVVTIASTTSGWKVGPQIYLPNIRDAKGEQWVQFTFSPVNVQADWRIDDVMVDPWIAR